MQPVFTAKSNRSKIHDVQIFIDNVHIAELVKLDGIGICFRIAVINPVDIFCHQKYVGAYFGCAKSCARIGREIRIAGAACENNHSAAFKMTNCFTQNKRFGNLRNTECRLYSYRDVVAFDSVLQCKRIHDGCKHAHMIGGNSVHILTLSSAPEITSAHHYADFHAFFVKFDNL